VKPIARPRFALKDKPITRNTEKRLLYVRKVLRFFLLQSTIRRFLITNSYHFSHDIMRLIGNVIDVWKHYIWTLTGSQ